MAGPESAGPSASPSPTSTVYQPDTEQDDRVLNGRLHDPERGNVATQEKTGRDSGGRPNSPGSESRNGNGDKEKEDWIVKWDGPDDPDCPLNTPQWRKWYAFYDPYTDQRRWTLIR
jgi:hypothetical protein